MRIFAGGPGGATFSNRFSELVTAARRDFVRAADWLDLDPTAITADTPVPFDIRPIWLRLDVENRETRRIAADPASVCQTNPGDAATLRAAQFDPYGPGGQPPHKGPMYGAYGTSPDLLRLGLLDPQLRFFQEPVGDPHGRDPLVQVMQEWLGGNQPVPSLRTHEAIVSGEAVVLPARMILDKPDPWPQAEDPSLRPWRADPQVPDVGPALAAWRGTYE